jgi:ABC-type multidrug transport system ATPase subunit
LKNLNFLNNFENIIKCFKEFDENSSKYYKEKVIIKDENNSSDFSNGEKAHLLLHEYLDKNKDYYLLDEPGVFLGKESLTNFLLPKIAELSKKRKTIVIATHNSSLGINTIPINYIYRKYLKANDECQTYMGSI